MPDKDLLSKFSSVADKLIERKMELAEAYMSVGSVSKRSLRTGERVAQQLRDIEPTLKPLEGRRGICGEGEEVAFLTAYNSDSIGSFLIARQLAVGNNVRMKPSDIVARAGKIIGSIWHDVFPENVTYDFRSGPEFMKWAIWEPKVKAIVLFGSHLVAFDYLDDIKAAKKKFIFEGPGKNPFIVLEDADIKKAAEGLYLARYGGAGQACVSPGIMYVHSKVFDEFIDYFVELSKKLVVGDPKDPKTDIGPLGSRLAVTRIGEQLQDAKLKGGKIIYGGKIEGNLVYPTIIVNTNHSMKGMREESFGPICWFEAFDSTEEVIESAKDNEFGLQLMVYGQRDIERILAEFKGADYLYEVKDFVFGKYGSVMVNADLANMAKKGEGRINLQVLGGYGYSGWVWETINDEFILKQGPKDFAIETSVPI